LKLDDPDQFKTCLKLTVMIGYTIKPETIYASSR